MAFDLKIDASMRFRLVDSGEDLAKLAKFAGDFGLRMTTEGDHERRTGWVVVLETGDFAGSEAVIQALVYARALGAGSSISRVLDSVRQDLTRNAGQDPDVIVGSAPAH